MGYKNEAEVKKALGIDTWRSLSKDKVFQFAAMMPDMDREVALKIIEQLPEYTKFLTASLEILEREHESTLTSNSHSQDHVHRAYREIREVLKGKLGQEDIGWEETRYLIEQMMETARQESAKDTENKQFLDGIFKKAAIGAGAAAAMAIAFVGGRYILQNGGMSEDL
ncbi:hypothetical protein [Actinoplanes teichomyceticus]|uniref:Uncharacterized protein n=1 Tax=Actinoplanes teichomyceticus TaxID=1867 RepID=A0A561VLR3_ACTTI|nr:hypothetical protein [Actinoplanes teichomyceticus]TWG12553.1 hypothetical protein FHX34_105420 [Actinoplanes teichomyceticus]GIF13919.1 hypothetical protein Ate01nite_39510 [Actinoplanes teichomyceticus]